MAEITNPQVVAFANEKVRPLADAFFQVYYRAKAANQEYNANAIGSLINAAGSGNLITDGSETDGRTRIAGGDVYNSVTFWQAFIAFVEGNAVTTAARLDVITKPHVHGI
jgi:hypothetical protein